MGSAGKSSRRRARPPRGQIFEYQEVLRIGLRMPTVAEGQQSAIRRKRGTVVGRRGAISIRCPRLTDLKLLGKFVLVEQVPLRHVVHATWRSPDQMTKDRPSGVSAEPKIASGPLKRRSS